MALHLPLPLVFRDCVRAAKHNKITGESTLKKNCMRELHSTVCHYIQERKKAHKPKKNRRGHRPGVPGTPGGTKRGSTGRCPKDFLLFTIEKLTFLPGHRPGVPGTPGRPRRFQKFYVIFFLCAFSAPYTFAIPPTPDRPRIPIFWNRWFRGPKTPFPSTLPSSWKREFSVKNPHFRCVPLQKKRGFF